MQDFLFLQSIISFLVWVLAVPMCLVVLLVKPDWLSRVFRTDNTFSRKSIGIVGSSGFIIISFFFLIFIGIFAPNGYSDTKTTSKTKQKETKEEYIARQKEEHEKQDNKKQTKIVEIEKKVEYKTKTNSTSSLAKGIREVVKKGKIGRKTITYALVYENGIMTRKKLSENILVKPVTRLVNIGTYVAPKPKSTQTYEAPENNSSYYENCTAARAAGAAPVYRGDPGYGSHLDRDNDGVGCE